MGDQWKAMAIIGYAMAPGIVMALHRKGLLDDHEALEIFEQSLLNLETNEQVAGVDAPSIQLARRMLEVAIAEMRSAR